MKEFFVMKHFLTVEDDEEVRRLFGGTGNIRLQTLWGKNKICYNIVRWLRKNQSCFQHAIIEPMILVVSKHTTIWYHRFYSYEE